MTDKAVVSGEYTSFKHVKTRKVVTLEIEVPEERFQEVINILGMPVGGESKPVAVCLLDKDVLAGNNPEPKEQTEGEKLRTRAVMLCRDKEFQIFLGCKNITVIENEQRAKEYLCGHLGITSRSEIATDIRARNAFR